jgi:hypothetical protein
LGLLTGELLSHLLILIMFSLEFPLGIFTGDNLPTTLIPNKKFFKNNYRF